MVYTYSLDIDCSSPGTCNLFYSFRRGEEVNITDFNQVLAVSSMGSIRKDSTERDKKLLSSGILLCSHSCYSYLSVYIG